MTQSVKKTSQSEADALRPLSSLPEALSFRISRLAAINERSGGRYFKREYDLTLVEWRILGLTATEGMIHFTTLRDTLLLDKGQLSRTIKALVARGLIETRNSEADARQIDLHITPAGQELNDQALRFTSQRNAVLAGVLTQAERAEFERMLDLLIGHNQALLAKGITNG
ncbi:MarR family winged helix-turn-helix transcriptional regulator [Leisingera methylohalidivorans]|uniref:HTH marR-type domain-containing protein n=1 Tax=Leisingera methylohalidivorans DSM 14336 TaxID=999552 RepID=V9W0P0_9RHOB|nr:MarR family winged helix-turn-helix transcriptional regulator [Leisingera methylohalidivorans]AHD03569.1 hypothetical protein METH_22335 [Leisingera methylohalidivorans DSM 14336]